MAAPLPFFQFAYFVDSIDVAAQHWADVHQAGPFFVTSHHRPDEFSYRGTEVEADVSYAFGYSGEIQIQLIEQHDDTPSIYRDMFPTGFGHHHVARLIEEGDYEAERDRLVAAGFELASELRANDIRACYLDTRSTIDAYTELHTITPRILNTFARWHDAHAEWDGTGSPLRHHVSGS